MNRVIIIEDDQLLALVEERFITKLGYDVIGKASTGSGGLELINELKPDIVVMDQNLSDDITGIELLKTIRESGNPVPVIMLTGEACNELKQEATDLTNVDVLFKPITMDQLQLPLKEAAALANEISMYAA